MRPATSGSEIVCVRRSGGPPAFATPGGEKQRSNATEIVMKYIESSGKERLDVSAVKLCNTYFILWLLFVNRNPHPGFCFSTDCRRSATPNGWRSGEN